MSTHNLCFEQKYEKYRSFVSENFQFLEVNFSMYLNRRVYVMFNTSALFIFSSFIPFRIYLVFVTHRYKLMKLPILSSIFRCKQISKYNILKKY